MDPDLDPDQENLDFYSFVTYLWLFIFEEWCKCTFKKYWAKKIVCWPLEGHWRKEQNPDPLARGTDPRIRTNMSRIRNTGFNYSASLEKDLQTFFTNFWFFSPKYTNIKHDFQFFFAKRGVWASGSVVINTDPRQRHNLALFLLTSVPYPDLPDPHGFWASRIRIRIRIH